MPPSASRRVLSLVAVLLSLVAATRLIRGASVAGAAVEHGVGYSATVLGFTSWYGSYRMGDSGEAWCIDHGSHAPDAAFGYVPTPVDDVPDTTRRAIAWAMGAHGHEADRPTAAALMLVAHDLMGAVYPPGRIDVDALTAADIAGFGGDGADLIARAEVIKADALAHADLVPPLQLTIEMDAGVAVARVTDSAGKPAAGIEVTVVPTGPTITGPTRVATRDDGTARFSYTEVVGEDRINASATVPDLELHAMASTTNRAQRVAVPSTVALTAVTGYEVLAPTTTSVTWQTTRSTLPPRPTTTTSSTTSTSTTTTSTTTTAPQIAVATTAPSTTTTVPPTTSTTVAPTTTVPPTTVPATTSPPSTAPPTTATAPVTQPLPRTGSPTEALVCTGLGLVLFGTALRRIHAHGPRARSQ